MNRDTMRGIWVAAGLVVAAAGFAGPGTRGALAQADGRPGVAARAIVPAAARGAQLWVRRYNGPGDNGDTAQALAVSPGGAAVFVTGGGSGRITTIAYKTATGAPLWVTPAAGVGGRAAAVSPDGKTVFVTGTSGNTYATIAYAAATGRRLWMALSVKGFASSMAVSPGGSRVFVTGESWGGAATKMNYATVAYSAATGRRLWSARFSSPGAHGDHARSVAVSPSGTSVYVTGDSSGDYATVAYTAATGEQLWASRYTGPNNVDKYDSAYAIAVGPHSSRVYVTGLSMGSEPGADAFNFATIAYRA